MSKGIKAILIVLVFGFLFMIGGIFTLNNYKLISFNNGFSVRSRSIDFSQLQLNMAVVTAQRIYYRSSLTNSNEYVLVIESRDSLISNRVSRQQLNSLIEIAQLADVDVHSVNHSPVIITFISLGLVAIVISFIIAVIPVKKKPITNESNL